MIHLLEQYWAVEVPVNTVDSVIQFNTIYYDYPSANGDLESGYIKLPPGTWQIVCTSKEASEDDCAIIADLSFQDVVHGYNRTFFHDLLASKGCDLNKNYLILKKQ